MVEEIYGTLYIRIIIRNSSNTEIAVIDSGTRLAFCVNYEGDANNQNTLGRDMGWGAIKIVVICGNIIEKCTGVTNLNYNTILNAPDLTACATNTIVNFDQQIQHYQLIIIQHNNQI